MLSTIATDIKDFAISADGKEATFVLVTKYSGDIGVKVPSECLKAFRLAESAPSPLAADVTPAPTMAGPSASDRNAQATVDVSAQSTSEPKSTIVVPKNGQPAADQKPSVTVTVPKKWYVGAEADRRLVIVVLDPMTPTQSGFALYPKAAVELAGALVKKAETMPAPTAGGAPA